MAQKNQTDIIENTQNKSVNLVLIKLISYN